ncbi:hypothetical protein F4777DRAFT_559680 [Nemania sp. FL0916]|nr:hypothetical protein F4777DRAFT_559680 [Nemania sp. FL0916]
MPRVARNPSYSPTRGSPRALSQNSSSSSSIATEAFPAFIPPSVADQPSTPATAPAAMPAAGSSSTSTSSPSPFSGEQQDNSSLRVPGPLEFVAHASAPSLSTELRRRTTRANTFRTLEQFEEFESRPGWHPGAEPGIDPKKPDGGQGIIPLLRAQCQITVVDFSQDDLRIHEQSNAELIEFIQRPQPSWAKCRWINVNGLSWDVIQALGKYKDLHRLAIEDIMNTRNRTKVDWYPNHAFLILTCVKLICLPDSDDESSDEEDSDETSEKGLLHGARKRFRQWRSGKKVCHKSTASVLERGRRASIAGARPAYQPTGFSELFNPTTFRTLQRYHAAPNAARTEYMERHSAVVAKGLAVSAEQVAMFITSDNTVIAFFEQSADSIEEPILARLQSKTTILRKSCDASMVAQAIIDAIIDMAIPVTACYADIVGDLELDVLTHPNVKHTKSLYMIISEINKLFSFVNPIQALINSLRDHKTKLSQEAVSRELQNPMEGVIITPVTYTYLGDVYDHCVLITENLTQIKESANHMIDLIFNTIATYQNESMKQLTIATIIFLPLTFITGYFGQNFGNFPEADNHGTGYFWTIAIPVVFGTIVLLMRDVIYESIITFSQRRHILDIRRKKRERLKRARKLDRSRLPRGS